MKVRYLIVANCPVQQPRVLHYRAADCLIADLVVTKSFPSIFVLSTDSYASDGHKTQNIDFLDMRDYDVDRLLVVRRKDDYCD